ncbi:TetR family transcriptional regulator [Methylophilus sp. 'Pure River']|uniref:TetR family transcriptional regulator n=1 Tax=Methylophilus sp. 'Pure River' TaxID=3377117 RepID=UPI00398F6E64
MARKTKEDAQKTRDQILDAAEHVFYRKGFTLTTMADIAEAAELSRGAVYGHYKGKLEVATAMAERVIETVSPFQLQPTLAALGNLKQYCLHEIRSYIEPSSIQRVLFFLYIGIDDSPELLQLRFAWEKKRITQIDSLLKQAITQGELSADIDFDLISLYCQSVIEGVFSIIYFGSLSETQRWQRAEQLCEYGLQRLSMPLFQP